MNIDTDDETRIDGPLLAESKAQSLDYPMLTVLDIAEYLQLSEGAVRRIISNGNGPRTYKVGGAIRVYPSDLDDWIRSGASAQARSAPGHSSSAA